MKDSILPFAVHISVNQPLEVNNLRMRMGFANLLGIVDVGMVMHCICLLSFLQSRQQLPSRLPFLVLQIAGLGL